jgi:glycerate-2-kinase
VKELLRRLFAATLRELDAERAMVPHLTRYRERAARGERFLVLAYGKAARAMANAVVEQLPGARLRGLAVVPEGHDAPLPPFDVLAGGHPLPTEGSLRAGKRALELARSVTPDETVLFLASGGGSAMLESPIADGVTLDELRTLHRHPADESRPRGAVRGQGRPAGDRGSGRPRACDVRAQRRAAHRGARRRVGAEHACRARARGRA